MFYKRQASFVADFFLHTNTVLNNQLLPATSPLFPEPLRVVGSLGLIFFFFLSLVFSFCSAGPVHVRPVLYKGATPWDFLSVFVCLFGMYVLFHLVTI